MESVDEMSAWQEFSESYPDNIAVRGFLHTPATPSGDGLVLTHGAGANCQAPLLVALANEFSERGLTVLRFDLPFRQLRPHGPPIRGSAERDQQGVQHAIESMRKLVPGRVFAAGHSYGGRQSSICAASNPKLADGLLLLSYPLHPPQRPTELRTAHFPELQTAALFVSGSRDGFGTIDEMAAALKLITSRTRLLTVANSGHELLSKKNQDELPQRIADEFKEMFGAA
jgi:predicted alpha/beta-hydrolase family hydrolase